jgi:hypothetical protein
MTTTPTNAPPSEVVICLPKPAKAPGLRSAFTTLAAMSARDVAEGCVAFAPAEGTGQFYRYLDAIRLCDANTVLNPETWKPLLDDPREEDVVGDEIAPVGDWRKALREWSDRIYDANRPEAAIAALRARFLGTPLADIPDYLTGELPALFSAYPDGSLWLIRTNPLLFRRFTLVRMLVASRLAPDVFDENEAGREAHVVTLVEQSLSRGTNTGHLIDPLLLAFSPATLGFTLQWMPHSLVFLTGSTMSMMRDYPATPWALYDPALQTPYGPLARYADFIVDVPEGNITSLLQWWVRRLNVVYSYLLDPTNFADAFARHLPELQLAWFLTFERMLADLILIETGFAQPELLRQQAAFDLLDKAETMLGFGTRKAGKGFGRMLRRSSMLPRLDEAWDTIPMQARERFRRHGTRLFDSLYEEVRAHAYPHRRTPDGVKVWSEERERLEDVPNDEYVPHLVRAIRNSAHGFLHVLTSDQKQARLDRATLGSHDGKLPPEFADLAALLAFAFVANFERVVDGTWLPQP